MRPGPVAKRSSAARSGRSMPRQYACHWRRCGRDDHVAVRRGEHVVRHHVRVRVAIARHGLAGDALGDDRRCAHRHHGIEQRHVDVLALARTLGVPQRSEHGHGRIHAGQHVHHRHADLLRAAARQIVTLAGHAHQSADTLEDEVIAGLVRARAGLAVARDRAVDQRRIDRLQAFIVEPVALEVADLVVLEDDVRFGCELAHDRLTLRAGDVQRERLLAAVGAGEVGGIARGHALGVRQPRRAPRARVVADAGPLHLDDLGARSARFCAHHGPARMRDRSSTRTPASAPCMAAAISDRIPADHVGRALELEKLLRMAGMAISPIDSGVQPSLICTERTGRGWLIRMISLARTAKIWPLTSAADGLAR